MYERAKYKEGTWDNIKDPISARKYDGAHFFLSFNNKGVPSFISRRQSVRGDYPDRTEKLPHLASVLLPEYANTIHSIELIHTGFNSSKDADESHAAVSGILNSLPPRAIETQNLTGPIRAVLLDTITPKLPTFDAKIEYLQDLEKAFNKPELVFTPEYHEGREATENLIKSTRDNNHEGVIVLSKTLPEESNTRIKVKHFNTYNLLVTGVTQEVDKNGQLKNSAGALIVSDGSRKEVANVGTGLSHELRREIWDNKRAWLGKLIQVKAMDSTARRLRSPVYNGIADGDLDTI